MRVDTEQFPKHLARCERYRAEIQAIEARESRTALPPTPPRTTLDGYPIDHCPRCKRRICLVPVGANAYEDHDLEHFRAGEVHLCDGQVAEDRGKQLVYVNPEAGATWRVTNSKHRRKSGGPRGY
jgi:hypothetical protein